MKLKAGAILNNIGAEIGGFDPSVVKRVLSGDRDRCYGRVSDVCCHLLSLQRSLTPSTTAEHETRGRGSQPSNGNGTERLSADQLDQVLVLIDCLKGVIADWPQVPRGWKPRKAGEIHPHAKYHALRTSLGQHHQYFASYMAPVVPVS